MAAGIDTATNTESLVACIKSNGFTFVGRYYAIVNTGKTLTLSEAQALSSAGLYIVSIWQESGNSVDYFTFDQGRSDGKNAFSIAANDFGQPANTPVYYAVDFDATDADKQAILNYFSGVQQGYSDYLYEQQSYGNPQIPYYIGVYGSYWVLDWCKTQGIATYFWQAYPPLWSGGQNAYDWPGYNLRQRSNDETICGIPIDRDDSSGNGGGWKY